MKRYLFWAFLAVPGYAFAQVSWAPGPALTVFQSTVNDGAGGQTDPHLSGDWAVYTDNSITSIRVQNLDLGIPSDQVISHPDGSYDSLSDISGNTIVFTRVTMGVQGIYLVQIDPLGNPGPAVEVSPWPESLRRRAAVGDDTIAYEDRGYGGSGAFPPEIALSSAADPSAPAYRLTDDTIADEYPAVSPDGNAVVWIKCPTSTTCDVWRAERTAGVWGASEQVSGAAGSESLPDTNGPVTVYGSSAGGDENIRWSVKQGGSYVESWLDLPGVQRNPTISGSYIAFESSAAPGAQFDIFLFDLATNLLYQLTNTPVSETLTDVSSGPGGLLRVAWAQPKQVYPYDMDVYALSAIVPGRPPCEENGEPEDPAAVCADPGQHPLLAVLTLLRTDSDERDVMTTEVAARPGEGVLCVENTNATAGWVVLNGNTEIGPASFKRAVTSIARAVALEENNSLSALIAGAAGTSYTLRLYGTPECIAE